VLSRITLDRIMPRVDEFLSPSQHAYREGRSTVEALWAVQWIRAAAEVYTEKYSVLGIDLSKAFDCLRRDKLMDILEQRGIGSASDRKLIRFLLTETTLKVRVGRTVGEAFGTSVGTPQGDALSPVLFLVYLEEVMRNYPRADLLEGVANATVITYADDINMLLRERRGVEHRVEGEGECDCARCRVEILKATLPAHFLEYNMMINVTKTTEGEIYPKVCTVPAMLGSEIKTDLEVAAKIARAALAYRSMYRLWKSTPVASRTKVRLYNAVVLPHLTYGAGAMAFRQEEVSKLEKMQRRQLRQLLGHRWDQRMSNCELHQLVGVVPVGVAIVRSRWTLLGHLARRANGGSGSPASQAMQMYYRRRVVQSEPPRSRSHRGRLLTTVPRLLHRDVVATAARLGEARARGLMGVTELTCGSHMLALRQRADSRDRWAQVVQAIEETAQRAWLRREGLARVTRAARRVREAQAIAERVAAEGPRPARVRRERGRPRGERRQLRDRRARERVQMQQALASFVVREGPRRRRRGTRERPEREEAKR
jgi:hypothetical protein